MGTAIQTQVSTMLPKLTILTDVHQTAVFMGPLCTFKALGLIYTEMRYLLPHFSYDADIFSVMDLRYSTQVHLGDYRSLY